MDFLNIINPAIDNLARFNDENFANRMKILGTVFDGYVSDLFVTNIDPYKIEDDEWLQLFNIALKLSQIRSLTQSSCLIIINRLLFNFGHKGLISEKILLCFQRIERFRNELCNNYDPKQIIKDEWLTEYTLPIILMLTCLNKSEYEALRHEHREHPWKSYVWLRIIQLSTQKSNIKDPNEIFVTIVDWMKRVGHHIHQHDDTVTIVFLNTVFETIIMKNINSILFSPNIETIISFILDAHYDKSPLVNENQVNEFIHKAQQAMRNILLLRASPLTYQNLSKTLIAPRLFSLIDFNEILSQGDHFEQRFINIPSEISMIISKQPPHDFINLKMEPNVQSFCDFVKLVNEWIAWFQQFFDIFQYVIEWLRTFHVDGAAELNFAINSSRNKRTAQVSEMKKTANKIMTMLQSIKCLKQLCHILNCSVPLKVIERSTKYEAQDAKKFIQDLKRLNASNSFLVDSGEIIFKRCEISNRQHVYWSLASENWSCDASIWFQRGDSLDDANLLFCEENIPTDKFVYHGEFETLYSGQLIIQITNKKHNPRSVWYQVKQNDLPACHLFDGITQLCYNDDRAQKERIAIRDFADKLDNSVFPYVEQLLDGKIKLSDMAELEKIFCGENIHISHEVTTLLTNRLINDGQHPVTTMANNKLPNEQICKRLQIFQYYSHIKVILDCIKKFDIISNTDGNNELDELKQLSSKQDCSLENICQDHGVLTQEFQNISSKHLDLIKIANECPNIIELMKEFDLYSDKGRQKFQELRDNLTIQFQLQERNNIMLNSFIITYTLCEPFVLKAKTLKEFVSHIVNLVNFDTHSLRHMKETNTNTQIIRMWLSAEETTVFDNALVVMTHLYKTGKVAIRLRHLLHEQSSLEINYFIDKTQSATSNTEMTNREKRNDESSDDEQESRPDKIKVTLSMTDIEDHKRQLTFCNVDLPESMFHMKIVLAEQMKLLKLIGDIYSTFIKLEMSGHPNYQLRSKHFKIYSLTNPINPVLLTSQENEDIDQTELKDMVQSRTEYFTKIWNRLDRDYNDWIDRLQEWRTKSHLLTLFSNRQIMTMIILLTNSESNRRIKLELFEKLYSYEEEGDYDDENVFEFTQYSLIFYLRSLPINESEPFENSVPAIYDHNTLTHDISVDGSLKYLDHFLNEFLNQSNQTIYKNLSNNESQQYLITLNPKSNTSETKQFECTLDLEMFCILLNLFNERLPSASQILWCSTVNEDDIHLFFSRIRTLPNMIFVILDIDKMHPRLREILLNEQDLLTNCREPHGIIYYFSRELTTYRRGLKFFHVPSDSRDVSKTYTKLTQLFEKTDRVPSKVYIICGKQGTGKTHRVNKEYKTKRTLCFSINDKLSLSSFISSLISYDSAMQGSQASVYINISNYAPFDDLNRTLFSLFACGSLIDPTSGLTFALPNMTRWEFFIEIPYSSKYNISLEENLNYLLPLLAIVAHSSIEKIANEDYQLHIGKEEELVARFLKAYSNGRIDRRPTTLFCSSYEFDTLDDENECRQYIYDCIDKYSPHGQRNKIYDMSFIKFLYRRVRFFTNFYYTLNETIENLGSTAMTQMIKEAKALSEISFRDDNYPRLYLVYDPDFSLHLLHNNWDEVPTTIKALWKNTDPLTRAEFVNRSHFLKCLSWLVDTKYETCEQIMNQMKFILTENFAYKLFHIHERKLTTLPLIIEGDTGIGKTYLLKFYSLLVNSNIQHSYDQAIFHKQILERANLWMSGIIFAKFLETQPNLLNEILQHLKPKLMNTDKEDVQEDDIDEELEYSNNDYDDYGDGNDDGDDDDDDNNDHRSWWDSLHVNTENEEHDQEDAGNEDIEDQSSTSSLRGRFLQMQRIRALLNEQNRNPFNAQSLDLFENSAERQSIDGINFELLKQCKTSLSESKNDSAMLVFIWRTILNVAQKNSASTTKRLLLAMREYVTSELANLPLIECSSKLDELFEDGPLNIRTSIEILEEYLSYSHVKSVFYRMLIHPGVTEQDIERFITPIAELASKWQDIQLVVFFDEVNTSSCLGLFKEIFTDRTLQGNSLPLNIFFTAAINPALDIPDQDNLVHRVDYLVHKLPDSLEHLKISYGALEPKTLNDYITQKVAKFDLNVAMEPELRTYLQGKLIEAILAAQAFCEEKLGKNTVSQREIQRCFTLIEYFYQSMKDEEEESDLDRCIALSIALIYYFRLPTEEDNKKRKDQKTPSREEFAKLLSKSLPRFIRIIQEELEKFVSATNFIIPSGVAINQAIREHIFAITISVVTRMPLCIIGAPGQSKTLSFQIVLQNLQGAQLSKTEFCKKLPAVDPFFCLGSKYTSSNDIACVFERAIKREQNYQQNRINTRCVVFLDEASLPNEKKMILKVLHQYLDECQVAFIAIANRAFDAANANRMTCIYRSLPSEDDQEVLAYGCLGLKNKGLTHPHLVDIITGLCHGYRRVLEYSEFSKIFHDRDFIYMLRQLRFELRSTLADQQDVVLDTIRPESLLHALENNFNGITSIQFEKIVDIFFKAVQDKRPDFEISSKGRQQHDANRDVINILQDSMKLESIQRRLYGRYKLIIDESDDESAVYLLFQTGVIDPNQTTVFRMSDFSDDINNELRSVEILSTIKLCMEAGKTILMVNTGRIHGSLYDVFNQNFSIMATGETRKIFSKVAIGSKTVDVVVHDNFQCIVHINRHEFDEIPAPFLSRFQKYSLSIVDFYRIQFERLSNEEQNIMNNVENKMKSFIKHFGQQYLYGLNDNTLYSCLLSVIETGENRQCSILNIHQNYSQLNIRTKRFVEENPGNKQQCLLRFILSKLIQIASPESIIFKLPTFEDKFAEALFKNYFQYQEHFNIENFVRELIQKPSDDNGSVNRITTDHTHIKMNIITTTKVIIYTRTSPYVVGINKASKYQLFSKQNNNRFNEKIEDMVEVLNLTVIENAATLEERFRIFGKESNKNVLIIIINGQMGQHRQHLPFVRQLVDKTEFDCNKNRTNTKQEKYFIMLVHVPAQELYSQDGFPSIFLHGWDFYFFDTCTPGSAFHLQRMLEIVSSPKKQLKESSKDVICDLTILFDDCLWDFCSRIQIFHSQPVREMFSDEYAYEFYDKQTSVTKRVECLKKILERLTHLQEQIVNIYHEQLSRKKNSSQNSYNKIYQISKDILCGKRFTGLIDSLQLQIRTSFTNFVSNIFRNLANDYGLETISKLSNSQMNIESILHLIDYSGFVLDDDSNGKSPSPSQGIFQIIIQNTFILQTPLYQLFHQRVKAHADDIKRILIETQNKSLSSNNQQTTTTSMNQITECSKEQFCSKLTKYMQKDKILTDIITENLLRCYSNDLVRIYCTAAEGKFDNDQNQSIEAINAISNWLLLKDDDVNTVSEISSTKLVSHLAQIHSTFEYEQNDISSLYSACRIINTFHQSRSYLNDLCQNKNSTRSYIREELFRVLFDLLWTRLRELCLNKDEKQIQQWSYMYTFINKYYPSGKLLRSTKLAEIGHQVEFMRLAYTILLNETISDPMQLIPRLLEYLPQENRLRISNNNKSSYLKRLPDIINTIHEYLGDCTLMIDFQQWIISILKTSEQRSQDDINSVFICLDDSRCKWSIPVKQLLFDELIDLTILQSQLEISSVVDRIECLLPIVMQCISDRSRLQDYQIPLHPSIVVQQSYDHRLVLFDLFFFHIERYANENVTNENLIHELMALKPPKVREQELSSSIKLVFKEFQEYFLLRLAAVHLCQIVSSNDGDHETNRFIDCLKVLIKKHLSLDETTTQLSPYLQIFLSTIISKHSWNFLLDLLKCEKIQTLNQTWANLLYRHLELKQKPRSNKYLQFSHQLQFTLSQESHILSIFPQLHGPYDELTQVIVACINNESGNRWASLFNWIQLKLNTPENKLQVTDIKVILLLNIYYNYYCNNQLHSLHNLLNAIEELLEFCPQELRVFYSILNPEEYMIGYPQQNNTIDFNYLNHLFRLDCEAADELCMRHCLVNLMGMIIKGGPKSFLWTFAFEPLSIVGTFGFGSTRQSTVQSFSVHYDCGCIISVNGELSQFTDNHQQNQLNVPAIYAVYFSTFGAMAWHLLLFEESVNNLCGPILSPGAISDRQADCHMAGDSLRAKVCHFVRARVLSVFNFLAIRSSQDDACILLNCCFERMAYLTVLPENSWIKPVYRDFSSKVQAELSYQNEVFYNVHDHFAEYKTYVDRLQLQSQIQFDLQQYTSQIPLIIQESHFKTEIHNPKNAQLCLRILQQFMDSTESFSITKHVYELSRFYLLLHQTYAHLIEREQISEITLKVLHDRAKEHLNNYTCWHRRNEARNHMDIIIQGIEAVNAYHTYTNGLIRPGPCDITQHFTKITLDTPVHYLITSENPDEGDLIMRILSILIDHHNNFLDLIEQEFENNTINQKNSSILRFLIKKLLPNQISLIQVALYNAGVITLNDNECSWINKITSASLILENEHFVKQGTPLNFDFTYIQSYIIRTYLLLCHINYKHIIQKYQFYEPRKMISAITLNDDDDEEFFDLHQNYSVPLEEEWNHLNDMLIDKLYHGYNVLKQIVTIIKEQQEDVSPLSVYEFIQSIPENESLMEQFIQYEVQDFKLSHLNHIGKLYRTLIRTFEYSFVNIPDLLRTPIDPNLSNQLQQIFESKLININYDENIDTLKINIQQINQLLHELKSIEDTLLQQSTESLKLTVEYIGIDDNEILLLIPQEIKCENYLSLSIYLNKVQSNLQEKKINIEEKTAHLWEENFDENRNEQDIIGKNRYHRQLHGNDRTDSTYSIDIPHDDDDEDDNNDNGDTIHEIDPPQYSSLFQIQINSVPITSCKSILENNEQEIQKLEPMKSVQKIFITYPDGKNESKIWKIDNLYEGFKQLFHTKKYDLNTYAIIDDRRILFDFTNTTNPVPSPLSLKYFIVERSALISIEVHLDKQQFNYMTVSDCTFQSLMGDIIKKQNFPSRSSNHRYCFYDEIGQYIQDGIVGDLYEMHKTLPIIIHIQEQDENTILYEITLISNQGELKKTTMYHPKAQWTQIELWRKLVLPQIESSCTFWNREKQSLINEDQLIELSDNIGTIIDGIALDDTVHIDLTFGENTQHIHTLKSVKIQDILNNQTFLGLNLNNCCLYSNDQLITKDDYRQQIDAYRRDDNNGTIHFRLMIPINILINNNNQEMKILLSDNSKTVEQLLQKIEIPDNRNLYLTSNDTQRIFQNDEFIVQLHTQDFILVEENETYYVSISFQNENKSVHQRFRTSAVVNNILKENGFDYNQQQLLYDNDFVPAENTPLSCFESPICFQLTDTILPSSITVVNPEDSNSSLMFFGRSSMSMKRILDIACQLFRIRKSYYFLHYDNSEIDEGILLEDLDTTDNRFEFKLISKASIKCSISYADRTITLPCNEEMEVSEIIQCALQSLHLENEEIDFYELFLINNDDRSETGNDLTIDDLLQMLYDEVKPEGTVILKFELERKYS
ncbi:unnamed protein product [Adineta steineri]|uniref:Uncharacterized protein n=1 Tax=Adineta steineri TaxID=433720 RepID=A0A819HKX6_9BILA|nr:unnamed protein product [Adineta steineri]CAF3897626.1 unnamed protein product [Adineta steineri]